MTDQLLLGLDLGTTGARAVLVDRDGALRASHSADYPMATPHPGWAEQDPDAWEAAAFEALRACAATAPDPTAVAGIGLTGQMHGATLLDADDRPVRPAIIWCDQRTGPQRREIEDVIGADEVVARTANPPLEGFTAPKLRWVREHEPRCYASIRRVLLPKDFIRFRLSGQAATDVADASGTALFDVRRRRWSEAMLRDLEVPAEWLPTVYESPARAGTLSGAPAERLGLPAGLPIAAGAGDQAAGGVAAGVIEPGDALVTIGSSGVVFAAADRPLVDPRGRGLVWLPYLQGERTPHLDPNARGVLFGLTSAHTRGDVVRAVMEGVAFSLRDGMEIIRELGVPVDRVRIAGGGARSALWRQIVADVLGAPVTPEPEERGPAFGAALLAGVAASVYGSVADACRATARDSTSLDPIPANRTRYDDLYGVYTDLYPALRPSFARIAGRQE